MLESVPHVPMATSDQGRRSDRRLHDRSLATLGCALNCAGRMDRDVILWSDCTFDGEKFLTGPVAITVAAGTISAIEPLAATGPPGPDVYDA